MGRNALPLQALQARGSRWAKYARKNEPKVEVIAPEKPPEMSQSASWYWDYIVPKLITMRILSLSDYALLVSMCVDWGEYWDAYKVVQSLNDGSKLFSGFPQDHPRVRMNQAFQRYYKAAVQFGLSPSSRSRVAAQDEQKQQDKKDRFFGPRLAQTA